MPVVVCSADKRIKALADLLVERWGVTEKELDNGHRVLTRSGTIATEGVEDGCSSYREVVEKALEVATAESLDCGGGSVLRILGEEFGLRIPWVFYNEGFQYDFDAKAWANAAAVVDSSFDSLRSEEYSGGGSSEKTALAHALFDELMPFPMMREGRVNPHTAVFRLFMAYRAAGIEASFALIPADPMGLPTPIHLALRIKGDGRDIIVDPAYETFDLMELPSIPLGFAQSLAIYYARLALEDKNPNRHLEVAHELDPDNSAVKAWRILADSSDDDPLNAVRVSTDFFFRVARDMVSHLKDKESKSPLPHKR